MNEEFFQAPIIRERPLKQGEPHEERMELATTELDGDHYFEPPIVRELNSKSDEELAGLFIKSQKSTSSIMSELLQALTSID